MTIPPDFIDNFFRELTDLLRLLEKAKTKKVDIPEEFKDKLALIEAHQKLLNRLNEETLERLGFTTGKIEQAVTNTENINPKDKQILETTKNFKKEIEKLKREIEPEVFIAKQKQKNIGKAAIRSREKRFRRMGGKKDWKSL